MGSTHSIQHWFATVPKAMEDLLEQEIAALGGRNVQVTLAGVVFEGDLETAYRVVLRSRLASRILLRLGDFGSRNRTELYQGVREIDWRNHLDTDTPFAVKCTTKGSELHHSEFAARVVKDAVADQFRKLAGSRPSVDRKSPGVIIHCRIANNRADLSLEISGGVLHRRGYRLQQGTASLRENVAAAILMRAGWPDAFSGKTAFIDPMCGSGTIVIEAALMAADIAPGCLPGAPGLNRWLGHRETLWQSLVDRALEDRRKGLSRLPVLRGYDPDPVMIEMAQKNAARAQIEHSVGFQCAPLTEIVPPQEISCGLLAVNPPYGKRMGRDEDVEAIHAQLGQMFASEFRGWKAAVITGEKSLARAVGLRAGKVNTIYNGGLQCVLAQYDLQPENEYRQYRACAGRRFGMEPQAKRRPAEAEAFRNRLVKNRRVLSSWLKKNRISCYRVYDSDMPNFAMAIDVYDHQWVVVQEYAPPGTIDPVKANDRLHEALAVIPEVMDIAETNIFLKRRHRQKSGSQYEKQAETAHYFEIHEGGFKFLVNFTDYLDTGIFLDHRPIRSRIREMASGKRFLNLFSYTGTATVYAAGGGARFSRSVDGSNTYIGWTEANLRRNGIDTNRHVLVRGDCMDWLAADTDHYDLIFCDPPTFSSSKDRPAFDLQKDHVRLIRQAVSRLAPGGLMIFSNNFRRFQLDQRALSSYNIQNITRETIPRDFQRSKRIHQCWLISVDASPRE